MAAGDLTLDFTSIGGTIFVVPLRCRAEEVEAGSFVSYQDIPQPQISINGCLEKTGSANPIAATYQLSGGLTGLELQALQKGFVLADKARRSGTSCEFKLIDEREFCHDTQPPERAYVAGSLAIDTTGTIDTTTHYAIRWAVFGSYPAVVSKSEFEGGCLFDISITIYEGSFFSRQDNNQ